LGAEGAVSWLLGKLDAAESVWATAAQVAAAAGSGSFVRGDYSLVPSGEADMDLFCSEWSNEVLEAAGVRNDDDDYFKVRVMCKGAGGRGAGELVGSLSSPPPPHTHTPRNTSSLYNIWSSRLGLHERDK
jgi:hypothetical protein